jgi:hypothetical protein
MKNTQAIAVAIVIPLAVAGVVFLIGFRKARSDDQRWHQGMAIEIATRNTCVSANASSRDENVKMQAHATVLILDKVILEDKKLKPSWSSFTDDELKALNAAKSDLSEAK